MPKFQFEIIDGVKIEDPVGMDCIEARARQVAEDIARQIAIEVAATTARNVRVLDGDGAEIHKIRVT
jgi:hypothetical protein